MTVPVQAPEGDVTDVPEVAVRAPGRGPIEGRSPWQLAWRRLRQDRVALVAGGVVLLILVIGILAPLLAGLEGQNSNSFHQDLIDPTYTTPLGGSGGISGTHWLGVEPDTGRDLFSRIVFGARISMVVAFGATLVTVAIGTVMGLVSGYFGGRLDTVIGRTMDILLAFPYVLFAIALVAVSDNATGVLGSVLGNRTLLLILIIGFLQWPYIGRIVRGQVLSLREKEFVESARSLGARPGYILFRELLPNLVAPILVYTTLIIPSNVLFEAALSFLGVGVRPPAPSWGGMLAQSAQYFRIDPEFLLVPGIALFITVLAFNLFGDGLRDALDARSNRG